MQKVIGISFGAAIVAFSLTSPRPASAQVATVIETQVPARPIPPPPEVRGREHRAKNNRYYGLRSSFPSVRQYYSNPVKTTPAYTQRPSFITAIRTTVSTRCIRIAVLISLRMDTAGVTVGRAEP